MGDRIASRPAQLDNKLNTFVPIPVTQSDSSTERKELQPVSKVLDMSATEPVSITLVI